MSELNLSDFTLSLQKINAWVQDPLVKRKSICPPSGFSVLEFFRREHERFRRISSNTLYNE